MHVSIERKSLFLTSYLGEFREFYGEVFKERNERKTKKEFLNKRLIFPNLLAD